MADRLSSLLCTLNPFEPMPAQLPVIPFGKGERVLRFLISPPNSKGMVTVETLPDLADGGKARQFSVKQSLVIKRMHRTQSRS